MAQATLSIDWGLLTLIGVQAAQETRDGLALNSGVMRMYEDALGKGNKKWNQAGSRYQVAVQMLVHTGITEFMSGYESYDPTAIEPNRGAFYQMAQSGMLMKIGIMEVRQYGSTTAGMRPKIESLTTNCMGFLHRNWTQRIVAGIGSGFTQWGTFNGFDFTGATGGIFERAAAGSQSNTIGGLSKATYANVIGWQNRVVNFANAFGTNANGLTQMVTATNRHKSSAKQAWLFSDAMMNNQKRAISANERYMVGDKLDSGRPIEFFAGRRVYQEPQMAVTTATGGAQTNTYPISALLVDPAEIYPVWAKGLKMGDTNVPDGYFGTGEWRQVSGMQNVWGCPIDVCGQLVTADMGSSAVGYAGEAY
jgi:hypothetical protein